MQRRVSTLPFFVILMGISALAMLVPSWHALFVNDFNVMRVFFYASILFGLLTLVLGFATSSEQGNSIIRNQLTTLIAAFLLLPIIFATPFYVAVGSTSFLNAWFEMVSSFTTTGATVYDNIGRLSPSLHLWRGIIGWMGGFLVWVTAFAIFAPMNLGGFEVRAPDQMGQMRTTPQVNRALDPTERLARYTFKLAPIYVSLTVVLWIALTFTGELPYIALIHAMSVLSTSGITPLGGFYYASSGIGGELIVFVFFAFAITRSFYSKGVLSEDHQPIKRDPEVIIAVCLIAIATTALFLRHFIWTIDTNQILTWRDQLIALWGALFTVTSFLTTTGFESSYWQETVDWSGLDAPGLILLGLALIGGGVATTAGGVKLLRVYALTRHGERELERLLHPSSVSGGGKDARQIRRRGAYISWVFFMLFAISIAGVMLLLALTGVQFETAMVLAIAALSTTGPLAVVAAETPISFAGIPDLAKVILAMAMVLGRLEALAIIALFNPEIWRK
jgi:trk system potassium uptake protein TrkH